jgi:hypothetical protein
VQVRGFRTSRSRLSGGDDVKSRWTLPSKDYLKYTYQPSIPDKHFFGANWNYAPSTMWLRHYRPLMEEVAQAGYGTTKSWVRCVLGPVRRFVQSNAPGMGHKIVAALAMWGAFSYVARSTYGDRMAAWALLDKIHSYANANKLAHEGFWDTEEMDQEKRENAATEMKDRLETLYQAALAEATEKNSFESLCAHIKVDESSELPVTDIPQPVSWRFGMVPFDNIDAHTFPDGDRKDIAVEVKPHVHENHDEHAAPGHVKLSAQRAKEIYASAISATAAHH